MSSIVESVASSMEGEEAQIIAAQMAKEAAADMMARYVLEARRPQIPPSSAEEPELLVPEEEPLEAPGDDRELRPWELALAQQAEELRDAHAAMDALRMVEQAEEEHKAEE